MTLTFQGSHGTTKDAYNGIRERGFLLGDGRYGEGAYFWLEGPHYEKLAEEWCVERKKENKYSSISSSLCIIFVKMTCDKDNFLDLENWKLRVRLNEMAIARKINQNDIQRIGTLYSVFIETYERCLKTAVWIYQVRVTMPNNSKYPFRVMGNPMCLVVKNTNCIFIESIKEIVGA